MKTIKQLLLILLLLSIASIAQAVKCEIPTIMETLMTDFNKNPEFQKLFEKSTVTEAGQFAEVWNALQKKGKKIIRVTPEYIEFTADQANSPPFNLTPKLRADYLKAVVAYEGTITNKKPANNFLDPKLPEKFEDYFNALKTYTNKFKDKDNKINISESHKKGISQDGFYFSMRYMNAKISKNDVSKIDKTFGSADDSCTTGQCRFDLETETIQNGEKVTTRYEFKSYGKDTALGPKLVPQLIGYIENANNLQSFKYVFNKNKMKKNEPDSVALENARTSMKTFLADNREAVFEAIKGNENLKKSMVGEAGLFLSVDDFTPDMIQTMVNNIVEVF